MLRASIEHFLRTGDHDPHFPAWSGGVIERERRAHDDLKRTLVDEVLRRSAGRHPAVEMPAIDLTTFTRAKVEPTVRGLFRRSDQERMLAVLTRSVVFLSPDRVESILLGCTWVSSAWQLANLYLGSLNAELLAEDAPRIVGLSEETTCFVSLDYFAETQRFADFIVHEAAHVFHNCKRHTVGLPETRRHGWLLEIDFRKRETFAYACEAFSQVVALSPKVAGRATLIDEYVDAFTPCDEDVDHEELVDILREAARAQTGGSTSSRAAPPVDRVEHRSRREQRHLRRSTAVEQRRARCAARHGLRDSSRTRSPPRSSSRGSRPSVTPPAVRSGAQQGGVHLARCS